MNLTLSGVVAAGESSVEADLIAGDDEVVAVVGPNGGGKTSLLRAIAGLNPLSAGRLSVDGHVWDDATSGRFVAPEDRSVGYVFQDYLLFPNLSALDNVAFGLRTTGLGRTAAGREAATWLDRLGVAAQGALWPSELSGGQSQRVALARALARRPAVMLLDEPTAALDADARIDIRHALREQVSATTGVRLLVTHDAIEARTLADRIVVIENRRLVEASRSRYGAELLGLNVIAGTADAGTVRNSTGAQVVTATSNTGAVYATFAPSAVVLHRDAPEGSARNAWPLTVRELRVDDDRVHVGLTGEVDLTALVTATSSHSLDLRPGAPVWASLKATEVTVTPA